MGTQARQATAMIDGLSIDRIEVTGFGEAQKRYIAGEVTATGAVSLADGTTLGLRTRLTTEESAALLDLCDAIGARVLRELREGMA